MPSQTIVGLPRLLSSLGIYTFLGFVPMATNLVVVPIYLRHLSQAEYGVLALANVSQVFVGLAVGLNLEAALERFYFDDADREAHVARVVGSALTILATSAVLVGVLLLLLGPATFRAALPNLPFFPFAWLVLFGALVQMVQSLGFVLFRNRQKPWLAAAATLLPFVFATAGTFAGVTTFDGGAVGALTGRVAGTAIGVVPIAIVLLRNCRWDFARSLLTGMVWYLAPLLPYSLLNNVLFQGDRILVERWFGLQSLGLYAVAAALTAPLEVVTNAGSQAVTPILYRGLADGSEGALKVVRAYFDALSALIAVGLVVLVLFSRSAIALLGKSEYVDAVRFIPILALSQLFRVRYVCESFPLFFFKRTAFLPVMTACSIVVGGGVAWVGARWLGPPGVCAGVVAWKASQQWLAQAYVVRAKLPRMAMKTSRALLIASIAYVGGVSVLGQRQPAAGIALWIASAALCLVAAATAYFAFASVKSELRSVLAPDSGVPARSTPQR